MAFEIAEVLLLGETAMFPSMAIIEADASQENLPADLIFIVYRDLDCNIEKCTVC